MRKILIAWISKKTLQNFRQYIEVPSNLEAQQHIPHPITMRQINVTDCQYIIKASLLCIGGSWLAICFALSCGKEGCHHIFYKRGYLMSKVIWILGLCVALLAPVGAGAVETKYVTTGSFRELYPNAIAVKSVVYNTAFYTGLRDKSPNKSPVNEYKAEYNRVASTAFDVSGEYCNGKSDYAIADHFQVHTTFNHDGALLFTTDYNVVCFNLPTVEPEAAQPKPKRK